MIQLQLWLFIFVFRAFDTSTTAGSVASVIYQQF